jgi:hypothetical protein
MKANVLVRASVLIPLLVVAAAGCRRDASTQPAVATPAASDRPAPREPAASREDQPTRDLSIDESKGGHTLARHVGKTDTELRERLRREPQISSASTYTDRATAEQAVGAALATSGRTLEAWENRTGRRPNLVLHYRNPKRQPIGRSLSRSQQASMPSARVLVVLRWDERSRTFYVLTSYPEAER